MPSSVFHLLILTPPCASPHKENLTHRHDYACQTDIRTQPLTNARGLPERTDEVVVLVAVDDTREYVVRICGGADCEENYEQEGLKVEERCLRVVSLLRSTLLLWAYTILAGVCGLRSLYRFR